MAGGLAGTYLACLIYSLGIARIDGKPRLVSYEMVHLLWQEITNECVKE